MKTSLQLLTIILLLTAGKLLAQETLAMNLPGDTKTSNSGTSGMVIYEFKASSFDNDLSSVSIDMIGGNLFGDQIARKLYLLETKYTYEVPIVPGNPQTKTIIRKPVIYEAVMKIERYLKKSVKKGTISTEMASKDFNKVLDVAFNILTADTESFEKDISKIRDIDSLKNLFTKRVHLNF